MSDVGLPGAQARLTADTSQFRTAIGGAQRTLRDLEPIVATNWWGLQNLSRAFGAVGAAVASGFGLAIREAMQWEDAMIGVERTTGATGSELDAIEASLRDVAATTPIAASAIASLAEQAGALGVENDAIPEFVRIMGTLIASTNLTENSTEDLARTMNVLGVPNESFERFASTLIEVGRNTAATETDILNLARRLGPAARSAGMSADEVLGLSAAIISLGPRAEAGSSAMTRAMGDISKAIGENGDELRAWATVAGTSAEEFAAKWGRDASGTIEDVIVGLGKFEGNSVALSQVLGHLDQANVRNIITLGSLASGINDVENQQTSLIAINDMAREAWRRNTAMAQVAERRASTLSSQLTMLRNRLSEVANDVGSVFLPPLKFIVGALQNFAAGLNALPGPLQVLIASVIAFVGFLSLMAGGVIALVGPLVLMSQTLRRVRETMAGTTAEQQKAKPATDALTRALGEQAAAAVRDGQAFIQLRNAQGQFAGTQKIVTGQTNAQNAANAGTAASAAAAGGALTGAGKSASKFGKIGLVVAGIAAAAAVGITLFGKSVRDAEKETDDAAEADMQLVSALEEVRKGARESADEILLTRIATAGLAVDAAELGEQLAAAGKQGFVLADVLSVINGSASSEFAAGLVSQLKEAEKAGNESAGALLDYIAVEHQVYLESARAAGILVDARKKLGNATEDAAQVEQDLADASEEVRERQDELNQAYADYVDAVFSQRTATLSAKEAQIDYARAMAEAADPAQRLAEAENDLEQARNSHLDAQRELAEAEEGLATARDRQLEDLADAEDGLADANDRYLDSLERIQEAEEALAKLRNGPSAEELLEATNKLANAHLRLRGAERAVEDAEWQLAYLRGEGSSQRAVEDAEFALEEARQEVLNETENVADAEKELADLREATPEEIADAERDLEQARRASESALRDIGEREREVAQLRDDVANDTAYLEALADIAEKQGAIHDSLRDIRDAEIELQRLRAGGIQDEAVRAQLDLEKALYDQAQAAVEVRKQQALMRGEFWDAGDSAHALADELEAIMGALPADAQGRMRDFINQLRKAKPLDAPETAERAFDPKQYGLPTVQDFTEHLGKLKAAIDGEKEPAKKKGWDWGAALGGAINGGMLGAMIGSGIAPGPGTIIGAFIGAILGALVSNFESIKQWYDDTVYPFFRETVGKALGDAWFDSWDFIQGIETWFNENFQKYIVDPIKRFFGIASPSTLMLGLGEDITQGLVDGVFGKMTDLANFGAEVAGSVARGFIGSINWLTGYGADIITGIWNGMGDIYTSFLNAGIDVMHGIGDGILSRWDWVWDKGLRLGGMLSDAVSKGLGWLLPGSPSKMGLAIGEGLGLGFRKGLQDEMSAILNSASSLADQVHKAATVDTDLFSQFSGTDLTDLALRQIQMPYTVPFTPSISESPLAQPQGDTFHITGADERDALDIAEEVMFKKLVRLPSGSR